MIKKIYERLDSTNIKAQEILDSGRYSESFWVQARDQYQGRGLGANKWISTADENITGSLVIFPESVKADQQFEISVMASLAVKDLVGLFCEDVKIKWPNDILVDGKKIAGLLVEHAIVGQGIKHSIIGIGLNVNQDIFPEGLHNPVSFKQLLLYDFNLNEITDLLLSCLNNRLKQMEEGEFALLRDAYFKSLFRYKEFAPYKVKGSWFRARLNGIDSYGQIILETETGKTQKYGFKEVEFID